MAEKEAKNEIKIEKNLHELLQEVRYELSKVEMKKSGHNSHLNFDYFELKDFVPTATKLFYERGITPMFNISVSNGMEYAILDLYRKGETITFSSPTAEPSGSNPIQSLGAKITYMRRYLYLMALDLVENDIVDAQDKTEPTVKYATKFQVNKILENGKVIADLLSELNIKTKNDLQALTMEKASELCKAIEERTKNG